MKKAVIVIGAGLSVLLFNACRTCPTADAYMPTDIRINVSDKLPAIRDSLLAQGVDSLFIYRKTCEDCPKQALVYDARREKKGPAYSIPAFAYPAYIFWHRNGKYYVQKIDQFHSYRPIERVESTQLPLYHFLEINRPFLLTEHPVEQLTDTLQTSVPYGPTRTSVKPVPVYYYEPRENGQSSLVPMSNRIHISCFISGWEFQKILNENQFNPVADRQAVLQMQRNHPQSVVRNDEEHYLLNRSMKIYEWSRWVESELFDMEMRRLWQPETRR